MVNYLGWKKESYLLECWRFCCAPICFLHRDLEEASRNWTWPKIHLYFYYLFLWNWKHSLNPSFLIWKSGEHTQSFQLLGKLSVVQPWYLMAIRWNRTTVSATVPCPLLPLLCLGLHIAEVVKKYPCRRPRNHTDREQYSAKSLKLGYGSCFT